MKITTLLLLLFVSVGFSSCSKENKDKEVAPVKETPVEETIVGKWELISLHTSIYEDGKFVKEEKTDFTVYPKKPMMEFKADGTVVNIDYDKDPKSPAIETILTYVLKDNIVILTIEEKKLELKYTLTDNTIKFETENKDGEVVEKNVMNAKRIK